MKKISALFLLILLISGIACGGGSEESSKMDQSAKGDMDYTASPWTDGKDLSGTEVTIFGAFVNEDADRFEKSTAVFEEQTGIDLVYNGSGDFETLITVRTEGGDPPDLASFPQPGLAAELVQGNYIQDIGAWFGMDYLKKQFGDTWLNLANLGGIQAGVWYRANVKSLVWYNKLVFEAEGYAVPATWDELIALSDQMVADGYVPWSIGIESSGATGWPATDWLEDIMLRLYTPDVYDAWVAGNLKFNSPKFKKAIDYLTQIWFNPNYVLGGREGIVLTPFGDAVKPITQAENPPALMHRQASFITAFMPEKGAELGKTVDFFYLPPIDASVAKKPVLGAGDLISAFNDRPEVRAAMRFLSQGISAKGWIQAGGSHSPHKDADLAWYPSEFDRNIARLLQEASVFRFDGSDLMPGAVGAGTFWTEITDFVNNPDADLNEKLDNIDSSYPE